MSNKDMSQHIAHYRNIFIYLLIGTALTVGATYFEFNVKDSIAGAIFVGLLIASIKGYLVAANFMHLNDERSFILDKLTSLNASIKFLNVNQSNKIPFNQKPASRAAQG